MNLYFKNNNSNCQGQVHPTLMSFLL